MMLKHFALALIFLAIFEEISGNEYCDKYGKTHSMCKPAPGPNCTVAYKQFKFTSDQITQLLKQVNDVRQKVASGKETKSLGGTLPSASDMCEMKWDPELAKIAQNHADQCNYTHDCGECRAVLDKTKYPGVGQNIAMVGSSAKTDKHMEQFLYAADLWYSTEVGKFSKSDIDPFNFKSSTGHYSQLIWAGTCSVGCGGSSFYFKGFYRYFIVCNYGPAGNIVSTGYKVYKIGKPCSACPSGSCSTTYNALCA